MARAEWDVIAQRALTEALHQRDTGTDIARSRVTVHAFLERWLTDDAAVHVAPSTLVRYRQIVGRLTSLLGALRLQELRPAHVQDAYVRLLDDGWRLARCCTTTASCTKPSSKRSAGSCLVVTQPLP